MNVDNLNDTLQYAEIFDIRGSRYHDSMLLCPYARDREFSSLFTKVPLVNLENILDIPSGGGYLQKYLHRNKPYLNLSVQNLELTSGFGSQSTVVKLESSWPVKPTSINRVICLAAAHHIFDLSPFFLQVQNLLCPGGFLHLADVAPRSGVASFLEDFVHHHTPGGHRGLYRDWFTEDYPVSFDVVDRSIRPCPWYFDNVEAMIAFCGGLFGLRNYSKSELEGALRDFIGVETHTNCVSLSWELAYVDLRLK